MSAPQVRLSSSSVANAYSIWFGRVVWLGVLANLSFALPAMFVPGFTLAFLNIEPAISSIWVQFSGLLLLLLSLFYLPAAHNLYHYRANAYLSIVSRFAGIVFFGISILWFGLSPAYWPLGVVDLVFGVVQGILLFFALRNERWA